MLTTKSGTREKPQAEQHKASQWQNTPTAIEALQRMICSHISAKPSRSVASLARRSGVPYTTVRRLSQGNGTPDLTTIHQILLVVTSHSGYLAYIQKFYPDCYEILRKTFAEKTSTPNHQTPKVDPVANAVVRLCFKEGGIPEEELLIYMKDRYGDRGLRSVRELKKYGYVIVKDGRAMLEPNSFKHTSTEVTLQYIGAMTRAFHVSLVDTDAASVAFVSRRVNTKALGLLKKAGQQYFKQLTELQTTKSSGEIPYYMILMQNTYDKETEISALLERP